MSELIKSFFRWYHGDSSFDWAQEQVEDRFNESVESALAVTLELVEGAPTVESLAYIGAGELEIYVLVRQLLTLLSEKHIHSFSLNTA